MILLRSLAYQICLVLSVVFFGAAIAISGRVVSHQVLAGLGRMWARGNLVALKYICGLDYRITGVQHLPAASAIVLCKHQSAWETIALRGILPTNQTWVLKKELLSVPFFGSALRQLAPIAIDRAAGLKAIKQLMKEGVPALNAGRIVVIFPEGTRVPPGTRVPYSIGGALLAERSGYPIVPITHNAGVFWGRRSLLKQPGTIDVVIGTPMVSTGKTAQQINYELEMWIEGTLVSLPQRP